RFGGSRQERRDTEGGEHDVRERAAHSGYEFLSRRWSTSGLSTSAGSVLGESSAIVGGLDLGDGDAVQEPRAIRARRLYWREHDSERRHSGIAHVVPQPDRDPPSQ